MKKERKKEGKGACMKWMVEHSPKTLASDEKATPTATCINIRSFFGLWMLRFTQILPEYPDFFNFFLLLLLLLHTFFPPLDTSLYLHSSITARAVSLKLLRPRYTTLYAFFLLATALLHKCTQVSVFVNWCFEPSQPLGIISGMKETFIKRCTVERTNKAEIRPEEQSQKTESCREKWWNEIQLKGP